MFFRKKREKQLESKWVYGLAAMFAVTLVLNGLAGSTIVLNGLNTAQVSDIYKTLFTPAGVTFSIWGLIYLLLVGYVAYALGFGRPKKTVIPDETRRDVTKYLVLNLGLNSLWIFAWQYRLIWLSPILIIGMLWTLIHIMNRLRTVKVTGREYVLAKLPFSVYFGWITVATVANIAAFVTTLDWQALHLSPGVWMVGVTLVAAAIGLATTLRYRDVAYLMVFIWAFTGILLNQITPMSAGGYNGEYPSTIITLTILIAVFISVALQMLWPRLVSRSK